MSTLTVRESSCPNATILCRFLHEELAGAEATAVETHVDACASCQEVLAGLVGAVTGPLDVLGTLSGREGSDAADTTPSNDSLMPAHGSLGKRIEIPGYEVLDVLGRGGMGIVYRAKQMRPARIVALKVLISGRHAGEKEQKRFLREAGAIAHLQHPYIVSLYEAGEHEGLPFLTLEFIAGGTLGDLLKTTPLPSVDAARLVERIARGIHFAHERGIVHRDLKPANILLHFADLGMSLDAAASEIALDAEGNPVRANLENAIPKITDFGLAKFIAVGADMSSANAVCGTPSYMPPEQAAGSMEGVGVASDVYALGAILYECLTSRPPFRGPTAADTLLQVISEDPVPPARLQPTVPPDLQTICLKCLQKKPQQRYAGALELAEDLRRFQAGEAIRARPVGYTERVVKWCRRRPAVASLAATVAVLIVVAGVLITWQWRTAVAALAEARAEKTARTQRQVAALPDAAPASVPAILEDLQASRDEIMSSLQESFRQETDPLRRMRLALALLPVDDAMRTPLMEWMLHAQDPAEVLLARDALRPFKSDLIPLLWAKAEDAKTPSGKRFRAMVALADYDPADPRWQKLGSEVVEHLLWSNPLHRSIWADSLRPLTKMLSGPMTDAGYFPLKVGNEWHYHGAKNDGGNKSLKLTTRVAKIEKIDGQDVARLEAEVNGEIVTTEHLRNTAHGLFRYRYNGTEISPPIQLLRFPIRIGDAWESEHRMGAARHSISCSIGSEEIEVPAGKFKTIKLRVEARTGEVRFTTTYWFAADIGMVKQSLDDDAVVTFVLEKFKRESPD